MAFLWRRRSSIVKIIVLLSAVWFTVAFLIYSEDRSRTGQAENLPLSLKRTDFREFDELNNINGDLNEDDAIGRNVIGNRDNDFDAGGDRIDGGKFGGGVDFPDEPPVADEVRKSGPYNEKKLKRTSVTKVKNAKDGKEEDCKYLF